MIAALFVKIDGVYSECDNVDLWDIERDAREYDGPYPIVGHPPCSLWCRLAYSIQASTNLKVGQDEGMFESCLSNVRKYGGIIEHPSRTLAWKKFGIRTPPINGGWIEADNYGGYTCHIEQYWHGHLALKPTWLYACKVHCLPDLKWNMCVDDTQRNPVGLIEHPTKEKRIKNTIDDNKIYLSGYEASKTPRAFRDILIDTARSVYGTRCNYCNVWDNRLGNHHLMTCLNWRSKFYISD